MNTISRRKFVQSIGAGAAAAWAARGFSAPAPERPNLLIMHTDEHNFRTLGCYRALLPPDQAFVWGPGLAVETPNIDWLAKNGAICDRFYAASPVCTPSRAGFVSGRYPQNTGAISNNLPMRDDIVTFAEVLRRGGYATGYAGKWHLDGPSKPGFGPARKFGFEDNRYMFNRGHYKVLEDTPEGPCVKAVDAKGNPTYSVAGADEKSFTTDFLADRTVEFIQAHKNGPFCYMVSFPDPHGPNTVRPPYDTMFDSLNLMWPKSSGKDEPMGFTGHDMHKYFGMVKCIDDNVGKILGALRANGLIDKTIIVFTSDHGDMGGEHDRYNKGIPLEGSARIPFVMYDPGRIKPGTVVHQALTGMDFKPTILSLMGAPKDPNDEGRDASALLLNGKAPEGWKDMVFVRIGGWVAAFTSRYKLIFSPTAAPEFYDLEKDPFEMRNAFADAKYRETIRALAKDLADYCQKHHEPHWDEPAVQADITWAAEGTGPYAAPARTGAAGKKGSAGNEGKAERKAGKAAAAKGGKKAKAKAGDEDEE
ncbi:MAG: sulfatase [Candidatus Sumerlaeota bacterium]|nr:sulfatase [Candidatus Sumerlaeota bacterium]